MTMVYGPWSMAAARDETYRRSTVSKSVQTRPVIFLAALPVGQKSLDVNLPAETRSFDSPALFPDQIVVEYTSAKTPLD
jgi:hypothetical protein